MPDTDLIRNKSQLAASLGRRQALELLEAGIAAVLPAALMAEALSFDPAARILRVKGAEHLLSGRVFVVGAGKASGLMAERLEKLLGSVICSGIVVDKADPLDFHTSRIRILQAGHPVPDERGLRAAEMMLGLKAEYSIGEGDTLLCLISGGGSSLLPCPADGISLADKQLTTRLLLACGADIYQINSVRKHLSRLKGGRLARFFAPSRVISLIISDVIGNDLSVIASGPTYPDPSTFRDALHVLAQYELLEKVPPNVISLLRKGSRAELEETPKSLENALNYIIGDNRLALEAMASRGSNLGLKPLILTDRQKGDTEAAAWQLAAAIGAGKYSAYDLILIGGETTPALPPQPGRGGRNQHFAALLPLLLADYPARWTFASLGTDGSDYLPEVAGAIVDHRTLADYRRLRPDYEYLLHGYDSNTLLGSLGASLILIGDTHTNVGDIMLFLLESR
jgi:glycerate 2-kinase